MTATTRFGGFIMAALVPALAATGGPEPGPGAPAAPARVELKPSLPRPVFIGTEIKVKVPNLLPPGTRPPPVMVPADATNNLAAGRPVEASDAAPVIGEAAMITDGDKEGGDGSYVELGPDRQWIRIDLGAPAEIHAVALWHDYAQGPVYHDVIVQVADDADFTAGVLTLFNNDHDNSSGHGAGRDPAYIETHNGWVCPGGGVRGRYVRCLSNGSTTGCMNRYVEVEVYGRAVPAAPATREGGRP